MKAHDSYLTSLLKLSDAIFNIPVYQRNYDWDINNCQQLFNDIETIAITGKDHFIGSIVYISIGTATEPYYNIIDGQQRITSVMLLLKAIHDSTTEPGLKKQIRHGFLINIGLDDNPKMKLKQIESDSSVYEKIIMQDDFDENAFADKEKESNVYRNYQYFKQCLEGTETPLHDLYNAVFKLEIIDVCLTTEDPQEVFESMNSTGKGLTNTDLLRNYLLMDLPHSKQEHLYKKYWSSIEKQVGNKQMDSFTVDYLIMKRKSDSINLNRRSSKVNKNTLYDCYKIYFPPASKHGDGTENLLSDMSKYAVYFHQITKTEGITTALDKAMYELVYEISGDPAIIFLMYLLQYQADNKIDDADLLRAVNACISYVFRVRIFKGSVSNQFFALAIQYFDRTDASLPFVDRVWEALTSGQGSYRFPKDRELQDAMQNKDMYLEFKPQMLRYILYKYEKDTTKEVVEQDNTTIEHILPQNYSRWQRHLMEVGDSNFADQVHKLGNLTLTKYNSDVSNDPFEEKKLVYKDSGYAMTREIATYKDWTSREIKARSAEMAKKAVELWPLPERYNQEDVASSTQYDVMDDATGELYDQLNNSILELFPFLHTSQKKWYVNYVDNKHIVCSVVPSTSYLYITLDADASTLTPAGDLEDVSGRGHLGVGKCRMKISNNDDVWQALDYLQQMLDANKGTRFYD